MGWAGQHHTHTHQYHTCMQTGCRRSRLGSLYMNGSTELELEDIKMCDIYTKIEIRVRVWCMPRTVADEIWVQCSVWGFVGVLFELWWKGHGGAQGHVGLV